MTEDIRSFKDAANEAGVALDLTKIDDVLGREITVTGIEFQQTQYGESMLVYAVDKDKVVKLLTSAGTLKSMFRKMVDVMPFKCTIAREGRYYTVS